MFVIIILCLHANKKLSGKLTIISKSIYKFSLEEEKPLLQRSPPCINVAEINVFSATIKVGQICLTQESCTEHIDSQQR